MTNYKFKRVGVSRKEAQRVDFEAFLIRRRLSPNNVKNLVKTYRKIVRDYGDEVSEDAVERVVADLRSKGRSANYINHFIVVYKYLAEAAGFKLNVKKVRVTRRVVDHLSLAELRAIFAAAANVRDLAMLEVLACGLRSKEVLELRPGDVDTKRGYLTIRDHGAGIKNGSEATVVLTKSACRALDEWLEARHADAPEYLFYTKHGRRMSGRALLAMVHATAKRAGVERRVWVHLFRHTTGCLLAASGVNVYAIQRQLNHKNIASTLIYVHPSLEAMKGQLEGAMSV